LTGSLFRSQRFPSANDRSRGVRGGWFESCAYPGGGDPGSSARPERRRRPVENGTAGGVAPCAGRRDKDRLTAAVLPAARPRTACPQSSSDRYEDRAPAPARPHSAAGIMGRRSGGRVPLHMAGAGTRWSREIFERTAALPTPRPRPTRTTERSTAALSGKGRPCSGGRVMPQPARGGGRGGILVLQRSG